MVGVVPYYDTNFRSVDTGLGPVVHSLRPTSCQCSTGLGPMRVVHIMTLTLDRLRLVWDQWYTLRDYNIGLGPVVGVVPYYDADFRSVETGLGPVLHTLRLTSCQCRTGLGPVRVVDTMALTLGRLRLLWDQWYTL